MLSFISYHNQKKLEKLIVFKRINSFKKGFEILTFLENKYKKEECKSFSQCWNLLQELEIFSFINESLAKNITKTNAINFLEKDLILNTSYEIKTNNNQNNNLEQIFSPDNLSNDFKNKIEIFILFYLQDNYNKNIKGNDKREIKFKSKLKIMNYTEGYMQLEENFVSFEIAKKFSYSILSRHGLFSEYRLIGLKNSSDFDLSVRNIPNLKDNKTLKMIIRLETVERIKKLSMKSSRNFSISDFYLQSLPTEEREDPEEEEEGERQMYTEEDFPKDIDILQNSEDEELFENEDDSDEGKSHYDRKKKIVSISNINGFHFSKIICKLKLGIKAKIFEIKEIGLLKNKSEIVSSLLIICKNKIFFLENYILSDFNIIKKINNNLEEKELVDWIAPNNSYEVINKKAK